MVITAAGGKGSGFDLHRAQTLMACIKAEGLGHRRHDVKVAIEEALKAYEASRPKPAPAAAAIAPMCVLYSCL